VPIPAAQTDAFLSNISQKLSQEIGEICAAGIEEFLLCAVILF
jgi:hypothetical protein